MSSRECLAQSAGQIIMCYGQICHTHVGGFGPHMDLSEIYPLRGMAQTCSAWLRFLNGGTGEHAAVNIVFLLGVIAVKLSYCYPS